MESSHLTTPVIHRVDPDRRSGCTDKADAFTSWVAIGTVKLSLRPQFSFNQPKIMLQIIKLKVDCWVARELRVPDMYME